MKINIYKTVEELLIAMADHFVTIAQNTIATKGKFNVALSGGNSPKKLYELLASAGYKKQVDWDKIYFFFGDERYVPATDPENNSYMVKKILFDPLNISTSKIFTINTSVSPLEAAKDYTKTIATYFNEKEIRFDLVLLGLGDNAHIASLFPYTPVLAETSATVQAVFLKEQNAYRITMTAPLINQAHHIAFFVYGSAKAEAVQHVLKDELNPEKYPAQLIKPSKGELQWYLDESAAAGLKEM